MMPDSAGLASILGAAVLEAIDRAVERAVAKRLPQPGGCAPAASPTFGTTEAAQYLGLTTDTVVQKIKRREIPASRLPGSRCWRIRRDDLDVLLQQAGSQPTCSMPAVDLTARRAQKIVDAVRKGR